MCTPRACLFAIVFLLLPISVGCSISEKEELDLGRQSHAQFEKQFGGKVPDTMDELLKLPGVARKTANVVLGVAYGKAEGVVVDTHVQRLSRRLEFSKEERPEKIELDLIQLFPRDRWILLAHLLIHHGRAKCTAQRPKCAECPIEDLCHSEDKTI